MSVGGDTARIFSLEVRRARHGDCLLLHFGTRREPRLAIIDGGADGSYADQLRPRLMEIRQSRGLGAHAPLPVDLLMVTHVDADHIAGILDLTRELVSASHAPLIEVASFWHNSFDAIIGNTPQELTAALSAQFGPAALTGNLPDEATLDEASEPEVVHDTLMVLSSIGQGDRLRRDAEKLAFPLNPEFDGKLILGAPQKHQMAAGLSFVVAGPMQREVLALQKQHDDWLKAQRRDRRPGAAALAAYVDPSVPNLASIVVLARCGSKKILLTGDARGDRILAGLETAGLLKPGKSLQVNVLKVPHHGSAHNVSPDFFERITANHYVFSGNGRHGNPERETIEMLFAAQPRGKFDLHFTYPLEEIDEARRVEWKRQQKVERERRATRAEAIEPREDWLPGKHALRALFESVTATRKRSVHVVEHDTPHVIDLMGPLA